MDTKKLLATLCASLMLAGCGDWKQNPLDGKKGNFGQGKPVPTKPDLTKPLQTDSVFIETPSDFQSTEEGMLIEFPIQGRVAVEGYTADVTIDNLADFPGAVYDKATGIFSWTPPAGFVESTGTTELQTTVGLKIVVFGNRPDHQVLFNEASYGITVSRGFKVPEILSANKPQAWLREGSTMLVPVEVLDKDAVESNRNTWPKVLLNSVNGSKSLAGLTTVYRDEALGGNRYRIYLQVDLREAELSESVDAFKVGLVAASRFGQLSPARELTLDVYTSFATPVTTWNDAVQVKETETITHKFMITDPKLEAWLSLDRVFSLPTGASLTCMPIGRGMMNCNFTWTPAEGQQGNYEISAYIKSRNNDARDTLQPTKTLYFRTQVLPKGS